VRKAFAIAFCLTTLVAGGALADDAACVAASEQSLTLRQSEKLHDALKQLAVCADPQCPAEVKEECSRRIVDIDNVMPTIILAAKDDAGNDLDAVKVSMDGASFAATLDGRPLSVDPGEHTFRFEVQGRSAVEKKLVIREGERDRRESIVIAVAPVPTAPSFWNAQRAIALIGGGAGVVSIGLGVMFGAFAISAQNQEKSDCSATSCLHFEQSVTDYNYAQMNATASTVMLIAGGLLAAGGIVLWFLAPRVHVAPMASAQTAGMSIGGEF